MNGGVLSMVAARLGRDTPAAMPAGVVLSIRSVRATTRTVAGGGTEAVIGVRATLGAFGGVLSKFPAGSGGRCFIASAAADPQAPEVLTLRRWRDEWLRSRPTGPALIAAYERVAPPIARFVAGSGRRRALVRALVVQPAARAARLLLPGRGG